MYERFSLCAYQAMELAADEAFVWKHEFMGPEHMLMGVCRVDEGVGASVLKQFDLDLDTIRAAVANLVLPGDEPVADAQVPLTPRAKNCIEVAMQQAVTHKHDFVGTAHLMMGVLADPESGSCSALQSADVDVQAMREHFTLALFSPAELFPNDCGPRLRE